MEGGTGLVCQYSSMHFNIVPVIRMVSMTVLMETTPFQCPLSVLNLSH